jgi:hypothetical protein
LISIIDLYIYFMKFYFSIVFLIILPFVTFGQKIADAASLKEVITLSNVKNKPILLIVNAPPQYTNNPAFKNPTYKSEEIVKRIKQNFLIAETNLLDTSIRSIIATYKITRFPAFIFMHPDKSVFHLDNGNDSNKNKYIAMVTTAISLSKETSLNELESKYLANKNDNQNLENLIKTRIKKGITNNADLIEQFVKNLKPADFNDYNTVLLIYKAGPLAYENAYRMARSNPKISDSIYKTENLKTRIEINNAIISNTLSAAIKNKNINLANSAASFARVSHGPNYPAAKRAYESNMLTYYKAVKDTAAYLPLAVAFYDNYYMTLSTDSIKKLEEKNQIKMFEQNTKLDPNAKVLTQAQFEQLKKNPIGMQSKKTILHVVGKSDNNTFATTLNNVAYDFYTFGTNNKHYLKTAMLWSKRSIELSPKAGFYDTFAHLLYKLGDHNEAIKNQEIAVSKAKVEKIDLMKMQEALKKMKEKTL